MSAFDDLADVLATDSNLSRAGVYRAGGVGPEIPVRVNFSRPMRDMGLGTTGLVARDIRAQIRLSEIANPKRGDSLKIDDGTIYKVVEPFPDGLNITAALTLSFIGTGTWAPPAPAPAPSGGGVAAPPQLLAVLLEDF